MTYAIPFEIPVDQPWQVPLRRRMAELDLGYEPVFAEVDVSGTSLVVALESLGAVSPPDIPVCWSFQAGGLDLDQRSNRAFLTIHGSRIWRFSGAFTFTLDGDRYGAARVGSGPTAATVLVAGSLADVAGLAARILEADGAGRRRYLEVFGAERGETRRLPWSVDVDALVLPEALKRDLIAYADAFARALTGPAGNGGRPLSRGILLLGRPGTGKTLAARHLLRRLAEARRYLFVRSTLRSSPYDERTFEALVQTIEAGTDPAVVLVEDVDRMFDGDITPQYFLNVLDGLLEPQAPVLWLATSNDPGAIAPNLLDRPGRFDRVFLFPEPDAAGRADLFRLYAVEHVAEDLVGDLARNADGLTGAHIREICYGATIRCETDALTYTEALRVELDRMTELHRQSRDYERALRGGAPPGFAVR